MHPADRYLTADVTHFVDTCRVQNTNNKDVRPLVNAESNYKNVTLIIENERLKH